MSQEMDDLVAQVAANDTVIGSAIALITGFKAKLDAAGTDPAALKKLSDDLGTNDQALADAISANTPVEDDATSDAPTDAGDAPTDAGTNAPTDAGSPL